MQGYTRPELWESSDYNLLLSSGLSMPATWSPDPCSNGSTDILVHMPEATYAWHEASVVG